LTKPVPREWQGPAIRRWIASGHRGIVEVVTGGGKTVFALACIDMLQPDTTLIVVPTIALLDQWWAEVASYFDLALDEVNIVTGTKQMRAGTVNLAVLNTASKLNRGGRERPCFLIMDECHKAASPQFRNTLQLPSVASLGLSATPERPYDEGLAEILIPSLGQVIYKYTYADALRDGVVVPFELRNIVFELETDRQQEYDTLTTAIARSIRKHGFDAQQSIALLLRRARILNLSMNRVKLALKIVAANREQRIIVFHEDIEACELINRVLVENHVKSGVYHSRLPVRQRAGILSQFRRGELDVLVTCRALDEGFNVPEAQIGIIAASTATRRQRIQRLGRVLRPSSDKDRATVYSLVATIPEITRLREEEAELEGVADVFWSRA
jgi:superfamily II DNA or RNA helicase